MSHRPWRHTVGRAALALICWAAGFSDARADDWPTFRRDYFRGGVTGEALDAVKLRQVWEHTAAHAPRPAWPGPARWDAFGKIRDLRSLRNYDPVHHAIAVGDAVYLASSADDTLRCLDAVTGKQRWAFTTGGPIRIAATYVETKLYFGSDDGYAYCLAADTGKLVWKYSPTPGERLVLNDGRLISFWPVRTGVVVHDGIAYFGASMLPWKKSYLCAVDADTGKVAGAGRYVRELDGQTMEGNLLLSAGRLIVPQGRVAPLLFDRVDGKPLGPLVGGTGGCFVLVTEDGQVVQGPGNRKGQITSADLLPAKPKAKVRVASFQRGNSVVVRGDTAWLLDDHAVRAIKRQTSAVTWRTHHAHACELLLAGDVLFVGGRDEVTAYHSADGKRLWQQPVRGRAYGLAVANGRLLVSTDEGRLHCFEAGKDAVPLPGPPKLDVGKEAPHAIAKVNHERVIGRWVFQEPHVKEGQGGLPAVDDLAGKSTGQFLAPQRLARVGAVQALVCDGESIGVELEADFRKARLPTEELTAEAWVRVDRAQDWGGIVGAFQDNGPYERGWLLGYVKDRFCLGIAAEGGGNVMTYLTADRPFEPERWHHVAGTYDGSEMRLYVDGRLAATSKKQKGKIRYPDKAFYHLGAYRDADEMYPLAGMIHEVRVYDAPLAEATLKAHHVARRALFPVPEGAGKPELSLAAGPVLRFTGPDRAVIRWTTHEATPTLLEFGDEDGTRVIRVDGPRVEHEATVAGLRPGRIYRYRIQAVVGKQTQASQPYECDMAGNFVGAAVARPPDGAMQSATATAATVLKLSDADQGICVVVGVSDGRLVHELARLSRLRVIAIDTDAGRVEKARTLLRDAGLYGPRATVLHVARLDDPALPPCFANLVVCGEEKSPAPAEALYRLVAPAGGVLVLGGANNVDREMLKRATDGLTGTRTFSDRGGVWVRVTRPALPGAGDWTHQYGRPDNSAFGGEDLAGARSTADLEALWLGQPGPRFNVDRNPRKPSPLAVGGRLFVQGFGRVGALDAYNGTMLWTLEVPRLKRYNVPHDCSNWCADAERLYLAIDDQCWLLRSANGSVDKVLRLADVLGPAAEGMDWGFVARAGDILVGSAVKRGSAFLGYWGPENWYDQKTGHAYVCSADLFALDPATGKKRWAYASGAVINTTITAAGDKIYFVESRNPALGKRPSGRLSGELWKDLHLVALDAATGKPSWSRPVTTLPGTAAYAMAHAEGRLVIAASDRGHFGVYTFAAGDGKPGWETKLRWESDHHGKHLSRPALVGGKVVLRPFVLELASGKELLKRFPPGHGCGSYAAASGMLVLRCGDLTAWDLESDVASRWSRLRPDCWISSIPAAGMLLSPEGGGGCSCGSWMETSVGFLPLAVK